MVSERRALFFDRDGVLNEPVWDERQNAFESPLTVDAVALVPGAAAGVQRAHAAGLATVIVSNQPAAAKATITLSDVWAIHAQVIELLADQNATIDASYLCIHHPVGSDVAPELRSACDCRKPQPGLLYQAATELDLDLERSWLIGDSDADVGAAINAGLAGVIVVAHPRSAHRRSSVTAQATATVATVGEAVDRVLFELS